MLIIENCNSLSDLRQKLIDGEEVRTARYESCEDAISRQAVVGYLCTHCPDDAECFEDCDDIKNIKSLPPVNPQPKEMM